MFLFDKGYASASVEYRRPVERLSVASRSLGQSIALGRRIRFRGDDRARPEGTHPHPAIVLTSTHRSTLSTSSRSVHTRAVIPVFVSLSRCMALPKPNADERRTARTSERTTAWLERTLRPHLCRNRTSGWNHLEREDRRRIKTRELMLMLWTWVRWSYSFRSGSTGWLKR